MRDVPEHLRTFDAAWLEVARQGPDGRAEALAAAVEWSEARRAWVEAHGYRGRMLDWLRAELATRRELAR